MMIKKLVAPVVVGLVLVPLTPAVASAASASAASLQWQPCREIAKGWPQDDHRTECAMLTVPVDYAKPDGRTLQLAVSRIKASGTRQGVILMNPGGPGNTGMDLPRKMLETRAKGIGVHHDLIGFAPRGIGYSSGVSCVDYNPPAPDPALSDKENARRAADYKAKADQGCVAKDPEFIRSLTTVTIARDMDRIRQALGVDKIGYYGISWGTALGAEYRTLFDDHVERMLLDSVLPPTLSLTEMDRGQLTAMEALFPQFATWVEQNDAEYHFGTSKRAVMTALLALRAAHPDLRDDIGSRLTALRAQWAEAAHQLAGLRAGTPFPDPADSTSTAAKPGTSGFGWQDPVNIDFNPFQMQSVLCNDSTSTRDFDTVWRHRQELSAALSITGAQGTYDQRCIGWPLPAQGWDYGPGTSPLQLVGHAYEYTTPIQWARAAQARTGGALLTVENDEHGSLDKLPCARRAVDFFDTGRTSDGTCPGAPIPAAA